MLYHAVFAAWGLLGPAILYRERRLRELRRREALFIGLVFGSACGAGILLGVRFQNTEANIHSGYSFASAFEWLALALFGGLLGAVVGAVLAVRARSWRPAVALFLALALAGGIGWVVSAARPTIDCDENPSFCDARY